MPPRFAPDRFVRQQQRDEIMRRFARFVNTYFNEPGQTLLLPPYPFLPFPASAMRPNYRFRGTAFNGSRTIATGPQFGKAFRN